MCSATKENMNFLKRKERSSETVQQESPGGYRGSLFKRKEKKLKYFEGVHRSVWALRCVSYEIYQLLADTSILYPIDVLKIWMKTKKSIKNIKSIISRRKV